MLIDFTRMCFTTLAYEIQQELRFLLLSKRRKTRVGPRMHQRLQRPRDISVVNEEVFFDIELRVTSFQITSTIVFNTMTQRQILCTRGSTNRISLHKPHPL